MFFSILLGHDLKGRLSETCCNVSPTHVDLVCIWQFAKGGKTKSTSEKILAIIFVQSERLA